ncbi:sensor histidine kinase [Neolewinella persica]|uniref:sensor histidine kinase n=1 Tax=Neolewinella persica TaxID=70998 RepID=UPI00036D7C2D|nr:histidine kinase [Neolewinella persica]
MKTTIFTPTRKEILGLACFYFAFALLYHGVLEYLTSPYTDASWLDFFSPRGFWENAGIQYLQYFIISVFIWLTIIRPLARRPQWQQFLAVMVAVFPAIYLMRELRYRWLESVGRWHLEGTNGVWDLYIPALFMLFQFGCYFAYANFRENQRKLKVEGELRQAALKSELAAIKAQLNPHFLYNVFNTINAALPPGSEDARNLVSRLSDLFRYQLRATQEDLVPLADELAFVTNYLDLEHARFGDRLQVDINVEPALLSRKVPPMLLQPLVENSIKHGLASLVEGGIITVDIFQREEKLHFRIADTGVGVTDKKRLFHKGVGLTNTRMRLEKMYGAVLQVADNHPRGLIVSFAL